MKKINLLLVVSLLFVVLSCKKDPNNSTPPNPNFVYKNISGIVVDENESPLADVTVNANGNTATTDATGAFFMPNISIPKDSLFVRFIKDNYFTNVRSGLVGAKSNIYVRVGMISKNVGTSTSFTTTAGGLLNVFGGSGSTVVTFPPNTNYLDASGVAYTGNVNVIGYYVDPSQTNYNTFACGTQIGRDSTLTRRHISAYGAMYVELSDDQGNKINLDPGSTTNNVTISMAIPATMLGSAPNDIFVWSNDYNKSYSNSEGHGSKQGNNYMCQVRHFSYWQTAISFAGEATIKGTVSNTLGDPVAGVKVTIGQGYAVTDASGHYQYKVPDNLTIPVDILPQDYYNQNVSGATSGPLNNGQVDIVNLVVPAMQKLTGNVFNCTNNNMAAFVQFLFWDPYFSVDRTIQTFTPTGQFSFMVPLGVYSGDLTAYTNGTSVMQTASLDGTTGGTVDVMICVVQLGPTKFTIQGGQFTSPTTFDQWDMTDGYYMSTSQKSEVSAYANLPLYVDFYMYFHGMTAGTYNIYPYPGSLPLKQLNSSDTAMVSLYIDTNSIRLSSGTVVVTNYNGVGGLIEGTFSGNGMDYWGNSYSITNGEFSVQRSQDQAYKKKKK